MSSLTALTYDLYIEQNATFKAAAQLVDANKQPLNLSTYIPKGQIRKNYKSDPIMTFSTLIADPSSGKIYITLTDEQTKQLPSGHLVYDVTLEDSNGNKYRVIEGTVEVSPYVTI